MLRVPDQHIGPVESLTGDVFGELVMSRLEASKKAFIEERRALGAKAGKEMAEQEFEYVDLFKLNEMHDRDSLGNMMYPLEAICEATGLSGDEIFGDEYQSERNDPEFLAAFVEAALDVFRAVA